MSNQTVPGEIETLQKEYLLCFKLFIVLYFKYYFLLVFSESFVECKRTSVGKVNFMRVEKKTFFNEKKHILISSFVLSNK